VFVVVRERTRIGRSVRVIRGNSMDVMLHLTRLNARKDESGEEKESAGLKALAG
jgi:hypothetical protein